MQIFIFFPLLERLAINKRKPASLHRSPVFSIKSINALESVRANYGTAVGRVRVGIEQVNHNTAKNSNTALFIHPVQVCISFK